MLAREAIALLQERRGKTQVCAGIEHLFDRNAEPREVGRVHLGQPHVDRVAGCHVAAHQRCALGDRTDAHARATIDVDRKIVAATLGHDQRHDGLGRDLGRALLRQHGDGGDGMDHCCVTVW